MKILRNSKPFFIFIKILTYSVLYTHVRQIIFHIIISSHLIYLFILETVLVKCLSASFHIEILKKTFLGTSTQHE